MSNFWGAYQYVVLILIKVLLKNTPLGLGQKLSLVCIFHFVCVSLVH